MLYLHAPGQPVHRIPPGIRTDAACYILERKATAACGCAGCRLSIWQMDVLWWHRMRAQLRTDRQRASYALRAVRLLDRAEGFLRCLAQERATRPDTAGMQALDELTIDRGIALISACVAQLRRPVN